jgi:hypothetical protein
MNECVFSADRQYRYLLIHRTEPQLAEQPCLWIGLNPSIADEHRLDNTLTRIRSFSIAAGFGSFYMANLFALVSTDIRAMKRHPEPVGKENDFHIGRVAARIPAIFVAWGAHGRHQNRDQQVIQLLAELSRTDLYCFGTNRNGSPKHPLHLSGQLKPIKYHP